MIFTVLILICTISLIQVRGIQPPARSAEYIREEAAAEAAVLRHFFWSLTREDPNWKIFFLAIEHQDPPKDFLKEFEAYPLPVKAVAEHIVVSPSPEGSMYWMHDKTTGAVGVVIDVQPPSFQSKQR